MNFGKHVKRKALYCCSVSVVGLLIACLIGFAMDAVSYTHLTLPTILRV